MKFFALIFLVFVLLLHCSREPKEDVSTRQELDVFTREEIKEILVRYYKPAISDLFSLEMTIGGEHTMARDEFNLVEPAIMVVNDEGDILLTDRGKIKVFDGNGNAKQIVGGPGEEPGKFYGIFAPFLGPSGYLLVADASGLESAYDRYASMSEPHHFYNLFAPDYTFLERKKFEDNPLLREYLKNNNINLEDLKKISNVFPLNDTEKVYEVAIENRKPGSDFKYYAEILYEKADTIVPLLRTGLHYSPGSVSTRFLLGELQWKLLPGRRIVYINTDEDTYNKGIWLSCSSKITGAQYTIHVLSINDGKDVQITHPFTVIEFPERFTQPHEYEGMPEELKRQEKLRARLFKVKKYYPSVFRLKIDRNYAFVFPFHEKDRKGEFETLTERQVDIFDLGAGEYLKTVNFPFVPAVIRNGYAYQRSLNEAGFPVIRKYKIDPAVYGK